MSPPLTRMNLAKAHILVVEDNPQSLEVLSQILLGFGVTRARKCEDAGEGRRALHQELFDLIIVDHDMGEENGLDFCRHVRADPRLRNYTTAVMLLTALPSRETIGEARDAGANFVLAKPISPAVLLQRIEWIARSNRAFVTSDGYRGPDRRFQNLPLPEGIEERRADNLRLVQDGERALSQDEVNALFD